MPPKRKDLLVKPKGKAKAKAQDPQSENDFLEAADEHEQAAGKWRAGDAAKATRFFNRAIEVYNEGLKRFPKSFDLAYNKANLEYNLTEDIRIIPHLGPKIPLLEETLVSHRAAIQLAPSTNTDILFNTAQVLTSLAEAVLEAETQQVAKVPARALLEEASDLFAKCLVSQQEEYERMAADMEAMKAQQHSDWDSDTVKQGYSDQDTSAMETASTTSSGPDEWATVEEPLTPLAILETCTAQLSALTTLLPLYDPADTSAIEPRAQQGLSTTNKSIPTLLTLIQNSPSDQQPVDDKSTAGPTLSLSSEPEDIETSPQDDAVLASAAFNAALAELQYRAAQITSAQYANTIESLFTTLTTQTQPQSQEQQLARQNTISAYADALMDLASAISETSLYSASSATNADAEIQWTSLTHAQKLLTSLASPPKDNSISAPPPLPAIRLASIFMARADVDLARFHISVSPTAAPAWVSSRAVLIANAGVFYRGARTYAEKAGDAATRETADGKAVVAEVLKEVSAAGDVNPGSVTVKEGWKGKGELVRRVLEGLVGEAVLGEAEARSVLEIVGV
ncbi:unnamed protein product [Periconia digitata]|uniref:TPR-like protein n=1 Tax=Periconia digitata TaxID=1303443 RepID=A0A9W4UGE0_9PLEO|nr:unnamed protein product [Periconia digitata]